VQNVRHELMAAIAMPEFEAVVGCHVTAEAVTCGSLANEKARNT